MTILYAMPYKIQWLTQSVRFTRGARYGRLGVIPSSIQRRSFNLIGCIFYGII